MRDRSDNEDQRLLDLLDDVLNHPLFRQGYNMGHAAGERARFLADLDQRRANQVPVIVSNRYGVGAGYLADRLEDRDVVVRELAGLDEDTAVVPSPCCGRRAIIPRDQESIVVCCKCGIAAAVLIAEDELDDDRMTYVAMCTITSTNIVIAQHRAGKWEPRRNLDRWDEWRAMRDRE